MYWWELNGDILGDGATSIMLVLWFYFGIFQVHDRCATAATVSVVRGMTHQLDSGVYGFVHNSALGRYSRVSWNYLFARKLQSEGVLCWSVSR